MPSIPAIKLLLPRPSNGYVVSLIYSVDVGQRWPLAMAYVGAAYGVDETGRIDRSDARAVAPFPEWAIHLLRNDLIENRRTATVEIRDVWASVPSIWMDWRVISGMVSALENGHKLLLSRKD